MTGLPRNPADRTPLDWELIDLGALGLKLIGYSFAAGALVASLVWWVCV